MDNTLKVVVKNVGEPPQVRTIKDEYTELKQLVGGYIETVPFVKGRLLLVFNEEGKLDELPPNLYLREDIICGNCFITKFDGKEDFESLSESDISFVTKELDKITLRSIADIKEGYCVAVTPRKVYNATCDERSGNIFFTIPHSEPIIGYLQTQLKQGKETITKKESEERLTIEPLRIEEMRRDWDNETNDDDSHLWRDDITSVEENLINLWDKGYTQTINKLATEIVELTQEPATPKESDEAELERE